MSTATRLYDVLTPDEQATLSALRRKAARADKLTAAGEAEWLVPTEAFADAAKLYTQSAHLIERLALIVYDHRRDLI